MHTRPLVAAAGLTIVLLVTACASAAPGAQPTSTTDAAGASTTVVVSTTGPGPLPVASSVPAPTTTLPGAVDPNAPEVVAPGDIPDNQAFIPYSSADAVYTVKVPEGWARTESAGQVTFTDNYNSIALRSSSATSAPTVVSVRTEGLADVAKDPTFTLIDVTLVTTKSGSGVLATYEIGSAANPVTGKKALLAVEHYEFFHNGTTVTMTLSGAKGADNVDPWKIVSDSLVWT